MRKKYQINPMLIFFRWEDKLGQVFKIILSYPTVIAHFWDLCCVCFLILPILVANIIVNNNLTAPNQSIDTSINM